ASRADREGPLHVARFAARHDAEWLDWSVVERGPVRSTLRAHGRVGTHRATLEVRLPAGERRVEVAATVDWRGMDGVLMLEWAPPFDGELWGGIPYGAERKELEREPYVGIERRRPGAFYAHGFVDWSDGRRGIAYVPHNGHV